MEIALNKGVNGIYQKEIAQNQDISYKYLDQILSALKASGLIAKAKGRKSGYVLTRDPSEITVYDVHRAFEPGICVIDCLALNFSCDREKNCALRGFWKDLNDQITGYLKSTTVKDLMLKQVQLEGSTSPE